MNLESVIDFANEANDEIGKYMVNVILSPKKMMSSEYDFTSLDWKSIRYGKEELEQVPDDKRGLYAFAVCHPSDILPPHGYVLYIGIAGRKSQRSLRKRYQDYLNRSKILKRKGIARMIGHWHDVLRFYYVPVDKDVSSEELEKLERQLNTALIPPFSKRDLEADTKRKRRAFP